MNNKFSRIISGCMSWGNWGRNLSSKEMTDLMHHCIENGLTTFDHADIYGGYTTEKAFGNALAASSIKRESIQLISKCGIQLQAESRNNKINHYMIAEYKNTNIRTVNSKIFAFYIALRNHFLKTICYSFDPNYSSDANFSF